MLHQKQIVAKFYSFCWEEFLKGKPKEYIFGLISKTHSTCFDNRKRSSVVKASLVLKVSIWGQFQQHAYLQL